jgi:transportin-1
MLTCLQDSFPELRQSAFALTGDLSKNFDYPMVCNNASWTVGELAIKVGGGAMAPYIPRLMHSFIQILHEKDIPTTLTENVAITVGRLGVTNTAHLADHLSEYLEVWCM